jgi:hypothetical protein
MTRSKDAEVTPDVPVVPKEPPANRPPVEYGGPKGPEPTRYDDWEKGGRCVDF